MRDKRIWEFKRRAEEDNLITAGACRLILRIASWRYCTRHHPADSEFCLSASDMAAWYDYEGPEVIEDPKTIYRWMRELVLNHYLHYNGVRGCPATSCYRLDFDYKPQRLWLFDWAAEKANQIVPVIPKKGELVILKRGEPVIPKMTQPVRAKIRPPIDRYSLREEKKAERKKFEPRDARAKNEGEKSSLAPLGQETKEGIKSESAPGKTPPPRKHGRGQGLPANWEQLKKADIPA